MMKDIVIVTVRPSKSSEKWIVLHIFLWLMAFAFFLLPYVEAVGDPRPSNIVAIGFLLTSVLLWVWRLMRKIVVTETEIRSVHFGIPVRRIAWADLRGYRIRHTPVQYYFRRAGIARMEGKSEPDYYTLLIYGKGRLPLRVGDTMQGYKTLKRHLKAREVERFPEPKK